MLMYTQRFRPLKEDMRYGQRVSMQPISEKSASATSPPFNVLTRAQQDDTPRYTVTTVKQAKPNQSAGQVDTLPDKLQKNGVMVNHNRFGELPPKQTQWIV